MICSSQYSSPNIHQANEFREKKTSLNLSGVCKKKKKKRKAI